jgi:hypothetical protein
MKKVCFTLMLALFAVGTSFATVTAPSSSDTPSQAQPPVDCKKSPDDPRCKGGKKPY